MSVFIEQSKLYNSFINSDNWIIINEIESRIKNKIEKYGTKLSNWNVSINRGVLTGYNEAFVIDGQTKDRLINEDEKSAEIIRPILRGRDINRYSYISCNLYLIFTHNGLKDGTIKPIDVNDYPAIKKHLNQYYDKLKKRYDQGHTMYNLRSCDYMEDFKKRKLVWTPVNSEYRFTILPENIYFNNSLFMITGEKLELLCAIMNSSLFKFYLQIMFSNGAYTYGSSSFFSQIPVLKNSCKESKIKEIVNQLLEHYSLEKYNELDRIIFEIYDITTEEINYILEKLIKN